MLRKITYLLVLGMIINPLYAKKLSESEKKIYSDKKTFEDICFAPDKASRSPISKHKLHIIYNGKTKSLPNNFKKMFGDDYITVQTNIKSSMPFIILFKDRDKYLNDQLDQLSPDTTITIYGTLRHKSIKKQIAYYFILDDFEVFKNQSILAGEFKKNDYTSLSPLEFKLKFSAYIDKKVALSLYPKEIINRISPVYQKLVGINVEDFYTINTVIIKKFDKLPPEGVDIEGFGVDVIAARANSNITDTLLTAPDNANFIFYGTLKKLINPTQQKSRPVYCFFLDAITVDVK